MGFQKFPFLLLLVLQASIEIDSKLLLKEVKFDCNKNYLILELDTKSIDGNTEYSGNITILQDAPKLWFKVQMGVADEDGKVKYDAYIVDTKINACKMATGFAAQFFVKSTFEKFERHSNLSIKCPIKKGYYQINKYRTNGEGFPSFIVQNKDMVVTLIITGKVAGVKQIIELLNLRLISEFN